MKIEHQVKTSPILPLGKVAWGTWASTPSGVLYYRFDANVVLKVNPAEAGLEYIQVDHDKEELVQIITDPFTLTIDPIAKELPF